MIETLLVFDIDGVICDSLESRQAAWAYASKKSSLGLGKLSPELIGLPLDEILRLHGVTEAEKVLSFRSHFETQLDDETRETLYPGAKDTLGILSSIPSVQIALFSGRPEKRILSALKSADLPEHTPFVSANGVDCPQKPSGQGLIFLGQLGVAKNSNKEIFVGDTRLDYLASQDADFKFIFTEWGYGKLPSGANPERVESWESLGQAIENVIQEG